MQDNPAASVPGGSMILTIALLALAIAAVVLLVLWLVNRAAAVRARAALQRAESDRVEFELTLAEQTDRLRIAGELDDLAAAALTDVIAQADRIRRIAGTDAGAATRAADGLVDAARRALADLRRGSTLARDGAADAAELGSTPGLADLDRLVDALAGTGVTATLRSFGEPFELTPAADLALLRIVQQALQNAAAHGGEGTTATVALRWSTDALQLQIDDDGERATAIRAGSDPDDPAAYSAGDDLAALTETPWGRGITEMRERTELFGGVFTANRIAGVGFSVVASFPDLRHHNGVHGVPL
ncbi:sensor histidine kinase [Schumannella sp. 10F1B-5-1]|uniref:sensor histidine kinase n=1 Tax=Schumannella sp. 10F1B-5-1 TaxID=2590780 RepID=UPI001130E1CE|nr:ATP-binding protein [Schumannella sp. 10F1B-5-1]TPW70822.1 ATP-binding protein [Schumannella sp. 10F1B-5-1]